MITNFHSHTTFCDGKNTAEEMLIAAIEKGLSSFGFSGHGYTPFDLSYCMKDDGLYISEINRLKEKYKGQIQVYLGIEEDIFSPQTRENFDYIISSSHYVRKNDIYIPVDFSPEITSKAIELFDNDVYAMTESYYSNFASYIKSRKPDIIGHFDLLTKFDEKNEPFFLADEKYKKISEKYLREALSCGSMFEVNTGAISRGWRTSPYPSESLLKIIKNEQGRIVLSSDTHNIESIDCYFAEARAWLRDIGFLYVFALDGGEWVKDWL